MTKIFVKLKYYLYICSVKFRHRNHPKTQDVYKVTFNGNPVSTEQIDKTIKVK